MLVTYFLIHKNDKSMTAMNTMLVTKKLLALGGIKLRQYNFIHISLLYLVKDYFA